MEQPDPRSPEPVVYYAPKRTALKRALAAVLGATASSLACRAVARRMLDWSQAHVSAWALLPAVVLLGIAALECFIVSIFLLWRAPFPVPSARLDEFGVWTVEGTQDRRSCSGTSSIPSRRTLMR